MDIAMAKINIFIKNTVSESDLFFHLRNSGVRAEKTENSLFFFLPLQSYGELPSDREHFQVVWDQGPF